LTNEIEGELVLRLVSQATDAKFEIIRQTPENPLPIKDVEWFIRCRNREDIGKTPYLNSVWKLKGGPIWLESLALGDTLGWIGSSYSEEAAEESIDLNYSEFSDEKFRAAFGNRYPLVQQRIQSLELIAEEVGKNHKVHVELRSIGSKGIVVFTLAARIFAQDPASLSKQVEACVAALRDAYRQATQS
jgi:hypothetical protein